MERRVYEESECVRPRLHCELQFQQSLHTRDSHLCELQTLNSMSALSKLENVERWRNPCLTSTLDDDLHRNQPITMESSHPSK